MFKNYMKIAIRNLRTRSLFSFINISGLAIGIATCALISLWVQRELSYDRFHEKAGRIYRVERELFRDNVYSRWPITSGAYKQSLIDDFPEIEDAVRFWPAEYAIKDSKNITHRQALFAADNAIFDIFDFSLENGDESTALEKPMSVVLTRAQALKFFGTENVIGKSLPFEWENKSVDFNVTGILKEVPKNSHVQFDMLISISSYSNNQFEDWRSNYLYTYILTKENTARNELEEKLKTFVSSRLEPHYGDLLSQGLGIHEVLKLHLFPVTGIHLNPSLNWEVDAGGSMVSVYMFSTIAIFILIIACINFMNLSTASANKRAKEVSLRKTIGAHKNQMRIQFIQESVLLAILALILAIVLLSIIIPAYNKIFNNTLSNDSLFLFKNIFILIGTTLLVGFLAGLYPAFYLTKFEPAGLLKNNKMLRDGKSKFRQNMVVFQFIISIVLIIGTLIIFKQMKHIQTKSLGFEKENVLIIPGRGQQIIQSFNNFRNELLLHSQIQSVAVSSDIPGEPFYSTTNFSRKDRSNEPVSLIFFTTDYDFVKTYKMEMAAGRVFSREFGSDTTGTIILNETAARRFGWTAQEAVGKDLAFFRGTVGKIVGVVRDFNFRSLHTKVEPIAMMLDSDYISAMSIRIQPGNIKQSIDVIQQTWEQTFQGEQFEFSFLDSRMNQLYENEKKMQNLFIIFSCFSIFVACLGLFGLSVFIAAERTKEIGIRKVLGASMSKILILMSKEFLTWIMVANIIAWPVAWFVMNQWLKNFAYRVHIGVGIFIISAVVAFMIALITVGFQSIKAAIANPVDSLRYE